LITSPRRLYLQDRAAFLSTTAVITVAWGIAVGALALSTGNPVHVGLMAALTTTLTYGLSTGLVIAASTTQFGTFMLWRIWMAAKGDLPWRLMAFLDDAHRNRGVLRSNGASYQFRHQYLQQKIAGVAVTPSQRGSSDPLRRVPSIDMSPGGTPQP
jgi:hypothetical protein